MARFRKEGCINLMKRRVSHEKFYPNGTPFVRETYQMGVLNGDATYFSKDGKSTTYHFYEGLPMNKISFASLVIAVCGFTGASAQSDLYKTLKQKFPDDPAVFVERSEVLTIQLKDDSLQVFTDVSEDILHLKEQSEAYASVACTGRTLTR